MRERARPGGGGEPDPACLRCGGILKSATVYFGQDARRATCVEACSRGRRRLRRLPRRRHVAAGAGRPPGWPTSPSRPARASSIVNAEPTPYDDLADLVVREPIGTALPRLVARA